MPLTQSLPPVSAARVWAVGALCRAIGDALEARFNPVAVRGEISGFSRAASGHTYFSLKDETGQLRCAMFRRAAAALDFQPRDGEQVEVRGRLAVYEPRGDLQLIVDSMTRAGRGALFEQFLQVKARLEAQGLFDPARKRGLAPLPRSIGLVTSRGAAALRDVVTALQRRVPHIPVIFAPAAVQGAGAPGEIAAALHSLYARAAELQLDAILLVRGGGSIEDLWAFNDEALAHVMAASPVPIISGVGHETDFTIADFVADLRAPTPTAAAELVAEPRSVWLGALELLREQLHEACIDHLDRENQRLDLLAHRVGRPSARLAAQGTRLATLAQRLQFARDRAFDQARRRFDTSGERLPRGLRLQLERQHQRLARAEARLGALDPTAVLQRGYAWLTDARGHTVTRAAQLTAGQAVQATLADGKVDLTVTRPSSN